MSTLVAAGHVLIGAKVGPALAGMAKVNSAFAATGAKGASTGKTLTKALTAPIALGFAYAIKSAADFESSLNDMQAVSKATDGQMKQVSATAKQLGADTKLPGTSAKDAAEAMVQLAKGGMTAKQSMDAARGTLMLAAAAGIDNAKAAEIQSDTLNAFGMKAREAGKVADVLAASANASTAEITDMAQSLQQSATVAHQAGYGLTETAVAISMMANEGIKGSDAGTSLKTMLMRLQAPIGTGAKAIGELGIKLRDASGELKPLPRLAQEFQRVLGPLAKADRDAAMARIFGTDAIRAGNILMTKSVADYAALTAQINANGAAQRLAEAKMKGFNGSLEAFKSTVETAAITIGQILLPMATQVVQKITEWAAAFDQLSPAQQRATVAILALTAAVGPALMLFSRFQGVAGGLGLSFGRIGGPLGIAVAALGMAALSSDSARSSFMQLGASVAPMVQALAQVASSPVVMFMVAGAAAAFGLVRAFLAVRTALAALTLAAAANPFGVFVVAAGLVAGAIAGLTISLGGGAASMQAMRDATNGAKTALDALKGATMGVEQANLTHKAAVLEVKAAQQGLATTQQQVSSGQISGKAAALALGQAHLRLEQANLGVKQSSKGVGDAVAKERTENVSANAQVSKAVAIAKERVDQAKRTINVFGETTRNVARLKDAQRDLANAQKMAGDNAAALTSKVRSADGSLATLSSKTTILSDRLKGLKGPSNLRIDARDLATGKVKKVERSMAALKPKTVPITANDRATAPIQSIKREIASIPTSKTITVNVVKRDPKGSWNTQEAIENLRKEPKQRTLRVTIQSNGTAEMQKTLRLSREVRDTISQARQNAGSLASSLASSVTAGIDAMTGRRIAALGDTDEARQLRAILAAQKSATSAREKARLQDAIDSAETDKDRKSAVADMWAWEIDQQRQALEEQLAGKEAAITAEADARKTAIERGLTDLTDGFNRGLIKQDEFNAQLRALLAASGVDYASLGDMLGSAFANGFQDALDGLKAQISLLASWAGISLPGADLTDPFATQMDQWNDRRKPIADRLADAKKALADARGDAIRGNSAEGGKISKAEQNRIDKAQDAVAAATKALSTWSQKNPRPVRAALGGVLRGSGNTDTIPLLAKPGEGVLSHRGMDSLMEMAMGRGGAGRSTVHLNVTVVDQTFAGMSSDQARRVADQIAPELDRRITLSA